MWVDINICEPAASGWSGKTEVRNEGEGEYSLTLSDSRVWSERLQQCKFTLCSIKLALEELDMIPRRTRFSESLLSWKLFTT